MGLPLGPRVDPESSIGVCPARPAQRQLFPPLSDNYFSPWGVVVVGCEPCLLPDAWMASQNEETKESCSVEA